MKINPFLFPKKQDKSRDIMREIQSKNIKVKYVELSGVNADECILETARGGLKIQQFPLIRIGPIFTFNYED